MLSMNLCMVEWESQKASQLPCPVSPSCGGSFVGSGSRGQRDSWGSGLSHAGYLGRSLPISRPQRIGTQLEPRHLGSPVVGGPSGLPVLQPLCLWAQRSTHPASGCPQSSLITHQASGREQAPQSRASCPLLLSPLTSERRSRLHLAGRTSQVWPVSHLCLDATLAPCPIPRPLAQVGGHVRVGLVQTPFHLLSELSLWKTWEAGPGSLSSTKYQALSPRILQMENQTQTKAGT